MWPVLKSFAAQALVRAGRKRHSLPELERLHTAPQTEDFNDSAYFAGLPRRPGEDAWLATRLAVRTAKPNERWLRLGLPGGLTLEADGEGEPTPSGTLSLGGLAFHVQEPGRRWRVTYAGDATPVGGGPARPVDLDAVFQATHPVVNFCRHAAAGPVARAMAAEPWSRAFFARFQEVSKVHYEQAGRLVGTLRVDGAAHTLDLLSVRDHSFGRRNWSRWERHLWWTAVLDGGAHVNVSMAQYDFLSATLIAGFYAEPLADGGAIDPVVAVDPFTALGPADTPPREGSLRARTRAGRTLDVRFQAQEILDFSMDDGAYRIREHLARFDVGGVSGRGVAELGWRAHGGR